RNDIGSALRCCGWRFNADGHIETEDGGIVADSEESIIRAEISACHSYAGLDSDNCRVCPLTEHFSGDLDDCFQDGSATVKMS
ncbi:hypothetical protein, partial [Listeria monocytogenes]|uniref:hypothetical protein n=1 Tax=Listeria monocytogenes TaxID=1639 RepID=UPI002FDBC673